MNGISWLLLIVILAAALWVVIFKLKNRHSGGCGSCTSCSSSNQKSQGCSSPQEHIIHIQKMGR